MTLTDFNVRISISISMSSFKLSWNCCSGSPWRFLLTVLTIWLSSLLEGEWTGTHVNFLVVKLEGPHWQMRSRWSHTACGIQSESNRHWVPTNARQAVSLETHKCVSGVTWHWHFFQSIVLSWKSVHVWDLSICNGWLPNLTHSRFSTLYP